MDTKWDNWSNKGYYDHELLAESINYYKMMFNKLNITTLDKTAIEIGAGHGMSTELFITLFKKIRAFEPNKVLYNDLENLKQKYGNLRTHNYSCEDLKEMKHTYKSVIFTYSFLFTNKTKCIEIINKILDNGGHLLILEPYRPLKLDDDFDKNTNFRNKVLESIQFLMSNKNYKLKYIGFRRGSIDILYERL